jgi:hypothetical protein
MINGPSAIARATSLVSLALLVAGFALAGEVNPPLPRTTVTIAGRVHVAAEVAGTPRERELGLSNRPGLGEGEGMLFLFGAVVPAGIWMKDMRFSLDILWIRDGRIVMIKDRVKPLRPEGPPEIFTAAADMVLEVPAGFTATKGITVGDTVRIGGKDASGSRGNR